MFAFCIEIITSCRLVFGSPTLKALESVTASFCVLATWFSESFRQRREIGLGGARLGRGSFRLRLAARQRLRGSQLRQHAVDTGGVHGGPFP